jgi:D-alanyl-D-alanine carboxypeptidase
MSRFPSLRCQLSAAVLLLVAGNSLVADAPANEPSGELVVRSAVVTPAEVLPRPTGDAPAFASLCPRKTRSVFNPSLADARWERSIERVAGRYSLGIAVGLDGRVIYAHDAARRRAPASNQKLLLSLALFERLGPRYRIPTQAAARRISDGVVQGDLWVLGRGDPTMTADEPGYWGEFEATTLADLAGRIKWAGVRRIEGRVMAAMDFFAQDFDAPGWQPYVPGRYVQLPSSLVLNGNYTVRGNPEKAVAAALAKQLERIDVHVAGAPRAGVPPVSVSRIATVRSRPLAELVAYMNRSSNNFFAEVFGKLLGAEVYEPPGTIKKGARAIEGWARAHGVDLAADDSSGLSYSNRVSPQAIVRLLGVAESKPWGRALRNALPAPGEGTLRYRLRGLNARAKTGSLFNGASTLSGWVRSSRDRQRVEFSMLGRNVPAAVQDRVVKIVSRARIRLPKQSPLGCTRSLSTSRKLGAAASAPGDARDTGIRWRHSIALGTYTSGRLVNGVQLPAEGRHFFTWDPVHKSVPNRGYRRFGTDRLIRIVLKVLEDYAAEHPRAPRVGIGDLSRPKGGDFGPQFGGLGHSSHQNGLDVDVYYPRRDGRERAPRRPHQIDRLLAQDLVDRFVRAGAVYVFVGPNTRLTGPQKVVQSLPYHDDHMHVRIPKKP